MKKLTKLPLLLLLISLVSCATVESEYSLYRENGKYGLIDEKREIVLSAEYDEIKYNDVYLCIKEEGTSIVYDSNLNILHEFDSDNKITIIAPWLFYFSKGDGFFEKWYYIKYDEAFALTEEFLNVLMENDLLP